MATTRTHHPTRSTESSGSRPTSDSSTSEQPHVSDRWCAGRTVHVSEVGDSRAIPIRIDESLGSLFEPWQIRPKANNINQASDGTMLDFSVAASFLSWYDSLQTLPQWTIPDYDHLHEAAMDWLRLPWWNQGPAQSFWFYTDGSNHASTSGSATALFVEQDGKWFWGGWVSKHFNTPIGSHTTELVALLDTVVWLNSLLRQKLHIYNRHPEVHLCFDATSAGFKAAGYWGDGSNPNLVQAIRQLRHLYQVRYGTYIHDWHIKAHNDHPGNEAANSLANWAATQKCHLDCPFIGNVMAHGCPDGLDWAWIFWKPEWKNFWKGARVYLPDCSSYPIDIPWDLGLAAYNDKQVEAEIVIKGLSANVLTLGTTGLAKYRKEAALQLTRLQGLQAQCQKEGFPILALQETRAKVNPRQEQADYWTFSAPADAKGCYGVQLAFARRIPYGRDVNGEALFWNLKHFKIVAASPRLLIVLVEAPALKLVCISAHAPHGGADEATMLAWWEDLHKSIPPKLRAIPTWVGIDANARVGTVETRAISSCGAEPQDDNGEFFQNFLHEHDLWVPSTWTANHIGPSTTWTHPGTGKRSRNDYIAISTHLQVTECRTWVAEEIDIATVREDHSAVAITFTYQALGTTQLREKRRQQIDVAQMVRQLTAPTGAALLFQAGNSLAVDWTIGVHEHYDRLVHHMNATLCQPFRKQRKQPIKKHLSSSTWELICCKQKARMHMKQTANESDLLLLRFCFGTWKGVHNAEIFWLELWTAKRHHAIAWGRFRHLGNAVTKAVRTDDAAFFDDLAATTQHIDESGDCRALWRDLRRVLPKYRLRRKVQPLQLQPLQEQWIPHFCQLEAGITSSFPKITANCVAQQLQRGKPENITLADLPTLTEIEAELRKVASNKAAGPDEIPGEALKLAAPFVAPLYHDLYLKMVMMNQEPIQNKGGLLVPIHKGGTVDDVAHFRGILLLNVGGKIFHAWLRKKILAQLQLDKPPGQIGGFPGQQVLFGVQSLTTLTQIFTSRGCSFMALFIDVQSAFHHLIRELVMGIDSPEHFEAALDELSVTQASDVTKRVKIGNVLKDLGAPSALIGLIQEVHGSTWFQVPTRPEVVQTHRGSRPGSPVADIVWHALMLSIHKEATAALVDYQPTASAFTQVGLQPEAITWADDLVIPIPAREAQELVPATIQILRIVMNSFASRGLKLNLKRGKTTGVPTFKGSGAPALRDAFLLHSDPALTIEEEDGVSWKLPLACSYRYLGACYVPEGGYEHEIARRIGIASTAFHELRKSVFQNRRLKVATRLRLLEVLVMTKLYYGVAIWANVSTKTFRRLDAFTLKLIRRTIGERSCEGGVANNELLRQYSLPPTSLRMTRCRLLYAAKLWKYAPAVLHEQLQCAAASHPHAWITQLQKDLQWVEKVNPPIREELGVDCLNPDNLVAIWQHQNPLWVRTVKRTSRLATMQQQVMDLATTWYAKFFRQLQEGGHRFNYNPLDLQSLTVTEAACACWCGRSFGSKKALAVHQWQAHQQHAPEFWLVRDPICPWCLKNFWSVTRARQHLAYIPRGGGVNQCFQQLMQRGVQREELVIEDVEIPGALKGINRLEAKPAYGPRLPHALPGEEDLRRARDQLQRLQQQAELKGLLCDWRTFMDTPLWQALTTFTSQQVVAPEAEELDIQDYDITSDWLDVLYEDDCRQENVGEDLPTLAIFLRWGQQALSPLMEEHGQGLTESYMEQAFYSLVSEFDEFRLDGQLDEKRTMVRALEQRQQQPPVAHRPPRAGVERPEARFAVYYEDSPFEVIEVYRFS